MNIDSELADQTVIVTGAAGCIGAWVIKLLAQAGANPIAYDLSDNRSRHDLISDDSKAIAWELGDISNYDRLLEVIKSHRATAIIHLAALQVPFCKSDPVASTRINVMGSINVLEAARQAGITRLTYASSVAAPAMGVNDWLATLYGAHKVCGEQMAQVYWQDWQVPSVGIRPSIIYGPGRDQGMSAAPTIALLAAMTGTAYQIPFTGPVAYVHAEDAAQRFVAAISRDTQGAPVFDLSGTSVDTQQVVAMIEQRFPSASIRCVGEPLPFPAEANDGKLDTFLKLAACREFTRGLDDTIALFEYAQNRGVLTTELTQQLIEKNT